MPHYLVENQRKMEKITEATSYIYVLSTFQQLLQLFPLSCHKTNTGAIQ